MAVPLILAGAAALNLGLGVLSYVERRKSAKGRRALIRERQRMQRRADEETSLSIDRQRELKLSQLLSSAASSGVSGSSSFTGATGGVFGNTSKQQTFLAEQQSSIGTQNQIVQGVEDAENKATIYGEIGQLTNQAASIFL